MGAPPQGEGSVKFFNGDKEPASVASFLEWLAGLPGRLCHLTYVASCVSKEGMSMSVQWRIPLGPWSHFGTPQRDSKGLVSHGAQKVVLLIPQVEVWPHGLHIL